MVTNGNYDDNCDGDNVIEQFTSASSTMMACKKEMRIFFLLLCVYFLIILFFASSKNLAACSFHPSCKELTEMEIEK
jgi:hypothetical protein